MNTKKIMAVMAVLIMAASCIVIAPAGESDGGSVEGISDLKVGEVAATKVTVSANMNDILKDLGPVIKTLVNEIAVYEFGISSEELIQIVKDAGLDKSATILENIVKDPKGYKITKADLLRLINDGLSMTQMGVSVSEIDLSLSVDNITGVKRLSQYEYRMIETSNGTIGLTLVFSSTNASIPSIILRDAKIDVREIQESTINFETAKTAITTKGESYVTFSGQSNFIDDKATVASDMFKILNKVQNFKFSIDMKEYVSYKISPDAGFKLPTVLDTEVDTNMNFDIQTSTEISSSNAAIQAAIGDQKHTYTDKYSMPATVALVRADNIIPADHYLITLYTTDAEGEKVVAGYVYCGERIFGMNFEGEAMTVLMICDIDSMSMTANITFVKDESEEVPTVIGDSIPSADISQYIFAYLATIMQNMPADVKVLITDDTFKVTIDGKTYDMSDFMTWLNERTVKYGADYVLTTEEINQFEKDVSKTAYALNYDILGFTGKQLNTNPDPESECPISLNMQILIVIIIAFLIDIIVLAVSSRRNKP